VLACGTLFVGALAACGAQADLSQPNCQTEEIRTLSLMAQSVRDATLIPCLAGIPAGWSFERLEVEENESEMELASDRAGDEALMVTLTRKCDLRGATQIPSDELGTDRYENITSVSPSYTGMRSYVFPGGCVTYRFNLNTSQPSVLLGEATLMVGFMPRAVLREQIERDTDGLVKDGP
jgi:hypothetical protein